MSDWISNNKGSGSWAFNSQEKKLGYLNNPFWTEEPADVNTHNPCGYWFRSIVVDSAFQSDTFQNDAFQIGEDIYL